MAETPIDLKTWARAGQFALFRGYDKPHYAITARVDVTHLMTVRKGQGVSPYRACLFAIGAGLHAVPELLMRFRGNDVVLHDSVALSFTVPRPDGGFNYAYLPFVPEFEGFDQTAAEVIKQTAESTTFGASDGQDDAVAYLSCMPWLDYTSLNNALPGPDDCIPRVAWGKIVPDSAERLTMAMTLEVHHALVDGAQIGGFFAAVQDNLDRL